MAVYEFFWKIWLRLNLLTKDVDNDYTAEVSTMKNTFRNEDIARAIVVEGSEIKFDTMLSIINQHDRIIREKVQQGYSVLTETCQFTPRVSGSWLSPSISIVSPIVIVLSTAPVAPSVTRLIPAPLSFTPSTSTPTFVNASRM